MKIPDELFSRYLEYLAQFLEGYTLVFENIWDERKQAVQSFLDITHLRPPPSCFNIAAR